MANSASDARSSEQEIRQTTHRKPRRGRDGRRRPEHVLHRHAALHALVLRQGQSAKRPAPTPFSSSTPATSTGRWTARTANGRPRRLASLPTSSASIAAKTSTSLSVATKPKRSSKKSSARNPKYTDVPGLCRAATLKEIEAQGWSLNPGRYVGVAAGEAVSDEDFKEQLETLNEELETLNAQARDLEQTIARNVAEILEA